MIPCRSFAILPLSMSMSISILRVRLDNHKSHNPEEFDFHTLSMLHDVLNTVFYSRERESILTTQALLLLCTRYQVPGIESMRKKRRSTA
jgi:hypothetical protein